MGTQTLASYISTGISLSTAGADLTPFTITQSGTVNVASGNAVYTNVAGAILLNEGSISAPAEGVYMQNGGTLTNASSGIITGTDAVRLGNGGGVVNTGFDSQSLANAGLISGTDDGVFVRGSVSSVINTGTISGSGSGMYFLGGGYIGNSGTFAGGYGVHVVDDPGIALTFNNTGTILATGRAVDVGGTGNQTIINQNLIDGDFMGVLITDSGTSLVTLINTGTILSQGFGVRTDTFGNAAIFNQGTIEDGVHLQSSATDTDFVLNSGTINGSSGIDIYNAAGSQTIINHGTISGSSYGIRLATSASSTTTIENAGTIAGAFGTAVGTQASDAGPLTLIIDPGAVFIGNVEAAAGASNTLELSAGAGSLSGIGTQFSNFTTIEFNSGAAWTLSGNTIGLAAGQEITGFYTHDTIDLTGFAATTETFSAGILTLSNGDLSEFLTITESPAITSADFTLQSDLATGTDITTDAICYTRGTRILTPTGEVPVEQLSIGDSVMTRFGGIQKIRWIGHQKYDWRFIRHNADKIPVRIAQGALGEHMPARTLAVSAGHSLLLGEILVLARDLVNGVTIRQEFNPTRDTGILEYYQIELKTHDCIIAEGCWAETYADAPGMRAQFHNALEYAALYPEAPPPDELRLCAPRPEHGAKHNAVLAPIIAQAWSGLKPGRLEGWVEHVTDWRIQGWALDTSNPTLPVLLEIWLGERMLGTTLARSAQPRGDLLRAGKGTGNCAFTFTSPVRITQAHQLRIRRQNDATELPHLQRTRRMG